MVFNTRTHEHASQTAGPYVHIGLVPPIAGLDNMYDGNYLGATMVNENTRGERVRIRGQIFDGFQTPLLDAIIELWQADASGIFCSSQASSTKSGPNFMGWGRQPTSHDDGSFIFETIKPGKVPYKDTGIFQAPHICVWIAARGINLGLHTRMYFSDEEEANSTDPILNSLEHQSRVETLTAKLLRTGEYEFNIHLQGEHETIFFDV